MNSSQAVELDLVCQRYHQRPSSLLIPHWPLLWRYWFDRAIAIQGSKADRERDAKVAAEWKAKHPADPPPWNDLPPPPPPANGHDAPVGVIDGQNFTIAGPLRWDAAPGEYWTPGQKE